MAQRAHKAPTQVTIATTEDESLLHEWVQRFWKPAAALAVLIVGLILGKQYLENKAAEEEAASWNRLSEEVTWSGFGPSLTLPSAAVLGGLSEELEGTAAGPWAELLEASKGVQDGQYEEAVAVLKQLEEEYPNHPLAKSEFPFGQTGSSSLREHLIGRMADLQSWEKENQSLFRNPAPVADAPQVRLNTSKGSILLALYGEQAPKHVKNFLKLCREGFYDGTLFHGVQSGMIHTGDPNSLDGDPETWGQGGPGYGLEPETSDLRHFSYVLSAFQTDADTETNGSLFSITTVAQHHLDGRRTVFGTLLDGKAVVDEIAAGQIVEGTANRPQDPVVLNSAQIVE